MVFLKSFNLHFSFNPTISKAVELLKYGIRVNAIVVAESWTPQYEKWITTLSNPEEKLKEISLKIYGADKTKEMKKINSFLAARSPKGGDKIYYVSPNRPTDSIKTLSFYEDTGMIAETYVAKKGDNLKKIAKNLLGYKPTKKFDDGLAETIEYFRKLYS